MLIWKSMRLVFLRDITLNYLQILLGDSYVQRVSQERRYIRNMIH
jgi:hypothetical protein